MEAWRSGGKGIFHQAMLSLRERASERAGKTGGVRAERSGNGRMKGDEVEGWRGGGQSLEDGGWHTLEVAKRRKGAGAGDRRGRGD